MGKYVALAGLLGMTGAAKADFDAPFAPKKWTFYAQDDGVGKLTCGYMDVWGTDQGAAYSVTKYWI